MRSSNRGAASRVRSRLVALWVIVATLLAIIAAPLAAQDTSGTDPLTPNEVDFEVIRVDLSGSNGLVAMRPGVASDPEQGLTVTIEGDTQEVNPTPIHRSPIGVQTIIVVDNSENADAIAGFSQVQAAALAYLDDLGSSTRVMLVEGGGGNIDTTALVPFTNNHRAVRSAIEAMTPQSGSVTWDAIGNSVRAFSAEPGGALRNVVAFIGSPGAASATTPAIARGNLLSNNAALTVVAPEAANLEVGEFLGAASAVRGGAFFRGTSEVDMVGAARNAAAAHESTIVGSFDTTSVVPLRTQGDADAPEPTGSISVDFAGNSDRVRVIPGGVSAGSGLVAGELVEVSRFALLQSSTAALIGIGLAVVAALLFSFSMMQIFAGADNSLNSTLSVYGSQDRTEEEQAADEAFQSQRSKIIEQVVERAEEAAASRGNLGSTTSMLEKAEIPLRVGEAFAIQIALILGALVLGFVIGGPFMALAFAVPVALIPIGIIKFRVRRRSNKLEAQLPDTLNLLSSTLKAGYSFIQGIDAVGNEAEEPLAGEFRRTVSEARLGKDLDLALDDLAERVDSIDLLWAIVAIKIQREVGGNLAELLSTVADTMTSRARMRGEVKALTAEGRMSALVLLLLPFGVGLAMYFLNEPYISTLWNHTFGFIALGVAGFSMVIGALWMRKIIDIEI